MSGPTVFFLHFGFGLLGCGAIFYTFFKLSRAEATSAPFGIVFIAILCGVLAINLSPWATPGVLALYALGNLWEWLQDRRAP